MVLLRYLYYVYESQSSSTSGNGQPNRGSTICVAPIYRHERVLGFNMTVEMSCVTGGTTRDFPMVTNRRQPNYVAPICQARFASRQKNSFPAIAPGCHPVLTLYWIARILDSIPTMTKECYMGVSTGSAPLLRSKQAMCSQPFWWRSGALFCRCCLLYWPWDLYLLEVKLLLEREFKVM